MLPTVALLRLKRDAATSVESSEGERGVIETAIPANT